MARLVSAFCCFLFLVVVRGVPVFDFYEEALLDPPFPEDSEVNAERKEELHTSVPMPSSGREEFAIGQDLAGHHELQNERAWNDSVDGTLLPSVKHDADHLFSTTKLASATQTMKDFVPTYEWQSLSESQSVPAGLEIRLPLDGVSQKEARIPPTWRLQLWLGKELGFFRPEVKRKMQLRELRTAIAEHLKIPSDCFTLLEHSGAVLGNDEATVEELGLFGLQSEIRVLLAERCAVQPS
mmetsp:Transcript_4262/g.10115  ORF Transcript_4262/g.10115 Transcript_4262/m.10115 type:complete len:239 (+) Transcript_4262:52-768(+)